MQHLKFSQQWVEDSHLVGCCTVSVDQYNSLNNTVSHASLSVLPARCNNVPQLQMLNLLHKHMQEF